MTPIPDAKRQLKILKAVLLLRKINTSQTKEEFIKEINDYLKKGYMTDNDLLEWIDSLKEYPAKWPEQLKAEAEEIERECELLAQQASEEMECYRLRDEKPYGPSNPWDAPGMCISDFI